MCSQTAWLNRDSLKYVQFRAKQITILASCKGGSGDSKTQQRAETCVANMLSFVQRFPYSSTSLHSLLEHVDEADVRGDTVGYIHDLLASHCTLLTDACLVDAMLRQHADHPLHLGVVEIDRELQHLPFEENPTRPFSQHAIEILLHHCPCNFAVITAAKTLVRSLWKLNRNHSVELENTVYLFYEREFDPAILECIKIHVAMANK
jgi:hypothetical protein